MKQAEIWYADLNTVKGSKQNSLEPVVIISGNLMNGLLNTVICCPLTSKIRQYKGNVVLQPDDLNKLRSPSEILTAHIRSVSKERLLRRIGKISVTQLEEIRTGLNEMLQY
jgi:mRNA interferase MazF